MCILVKVLENMHMSTCTYLKTCRHFLTNSIKYNFDSKSFHFISWFHLDNKHPIKLKSKQFSKQPSDLLNKMY